MSTGRGKQTEKTAKRGAKTNTPPTPPQGSRASAQPEFDGFVDRPGMPNAMTDAAENIAEILDEVPDAETAEALLQAAGQLYGAKITPLVELLKRQAPTIAAHFAGFLAALIDNVESVNDAIGPQLDRSAASTARGRRRKYAAYLRADFTEEQAFAMVLAEIKPIDYAALIRQAASSNDGGKKK